MQFIERKYRRLARKAGVAWRDVLGCYADLRALNQLERAADSVTRREVWECYSYGPEYQSFWRHGMRIRFPRAFADGDMTLIPRWDEVADSLGWDAQELFDFIGTDYVRRKSRAELLDEAFDWCVARRRTQEVCYAEDNVF